MGRRKVRAPFDFATELALFAQLPFRIEPITSADLRLLDRLSAIPELHDRLIAATGLRINAPILTSVSLKRSTAGWSAE